MKATFEHFGTIVDIGTGISLGERDTSNNIASGSPSGEIGVAIYQRDLVDAKCVRYVSGFFMKPSEARAMASAMLSAATEAR
jgi:hypothetical protein